MRIVYCTDSLNIVGGVPAVTVRKVNALAEIPGNKVWIITCCDESCSSFFPLSGKVSLIGIRVANDLSFPLNLFLLPWQILRLRRKIDGLLQQIDPDIVVSTPRIERWLVASLRGRWSKIIEYHAIKHFKIMKARSPGRRIMAHISDFFDYNVIANCYDRIVVSTDEDKDDNWKGNDKVSVIPNPISTHPVQESTLDSKRIIAIGRLVYEKNFTSLIRAFAYVVERHPGWKLDIIGEGPERQLLEKQIVCSSLENCVFLHGTQTDLPDWFIKSSIFVMTSHYEGLPLVLLEAINYGLPVVSYSFSCGPKDVITDGLNGYLVPRYDEKALAERICQLIEDDNLRRRMGAAAAERAKDYSTEKIIEMWMSLFKELTSLKTAS